MTSTKFFSSFEPEQGIAKSIPSRDGKAVYKQSEYDGTWWKVWNDDRPRVFIGVNPPKNP